MINISHSKYFKNEILKNIILFKFLFVIYLFDKIGQIYHFFFLFLFLFLETFFDFISIF